VGRSRFSRGEADGIRRLLREKGTADRDKQKALRAQLRRNYDFYISDFTAESGGFTASDFHELVARGAIEVADNSRAPLAEASSSSRRSQAVALSEIVLDDVLEVGLRVVFCGTAVGSRSARVRAYYAGPGNQFWGVLSRTRLTPRRLAPAEYADLPRYGIGLTDLAKFESGADAELSSAALGAAAVRARISHFAPRAVAFNGKRAGETFLGRRVDYGRQVESIDQTAIFVLPSTSGAARGFWDEAHWRECARLRP
jgi:TDG/mug DNA glycosylase family protein